MLDQTVTISGMTKDSGKHTPADDKPPSKPTQKSTQKQRLNEALRANLRRRKAPKTVTNLDTLGED